MWLMKVPNEVYKMFVEAEDGKAVGNVSLVAGAQGSGKKKYKMGMRLAGDEELTAFNIDELSKGPPVYAFDFDHTQGKFSRVGYVEKKTALRPVDSEKYKEGVRKRSIAAMTAHNIQKASNEEYGEILTLGTREVDFVAPAYATNKKKMAERAKSNGELDPKILQRNVLDTLVAHDRMTLKDISITCGALEKDVKAILQGIGTYIKSGRFKHFWELKQEFKDNTLEGADEAKP